MNNELDRGGLTEPARQELEDFYRELVTSYVNFPAALKLELKESYRSWALLIEPDVCDYAIVAGKRGRNFNALKELVDAIGERRKIEESFEILLEGPPAEDQRRIRKQLPYKVNPKWRPELIRPIVGKTLHQLGMSHIQLKMQKNPVADAVTNPYDDQWLYWWMGAKNIKEMKAMVALGQLMESIGTVQGQRLMPKLAEPAALEKAS